MHVGSNPPAVLTAIPAKSEMANVTAFVDVTNIAQYIQQEVMPRSCQKHLEYPSLTYVYTLSRPKMGLAHGS